MTNIWEDFAKLNGMTPTEFFNEITTVAMAVMQMKLEDDKTNNTNAIKVVHGDLTLMLVDNSK